MNYTKTMNLTKTALSCPYSERKNQSCSKNSSDNVIFIRYRAMIHAFKLCLLLIVVCAFGSAHGQEKGSLVVDTIHGSMHVTDPLIIELINCPAMQRLKQIRQYGTDDYVVKHKTIYNRFDHSLGVYYLLAHHGAGRAEQVAGLLHDISHTVFSHACDPLFMGDLTKGAYQDTIHEEFLKHYALEDILKKYGFTAADVLPKNEQFRALEQEAPALCADRIEYNLYAAYMDNLLSQDVLRAIRQDIHFDGYDWYFDHAAQARDFALISLHQTMHMWASPNNILIAHWTCQALSRALTIGLIEKEDIFYKLTDDHMWAKLNACNDTEIAAILHDIQHSNCLFSWSRRHETDTLVNLKAKFRGVDPFVKTEQGLKLLSQLDSEFKKEYEQVKLMVNKGWDVFVHQEPMGQLETDLLDPRLQCTASMMLQHNNDVCLVV